MKKLSNNEFIEKCKLIHGNKYNYDKTIYKNTRTKIIVICLIHGEFLISPDNHIGKQKQGCVKCAQEKHKLTQISPEKIIEFQKIHNNKYQYLDLLVNNGRINITCPIHGIFNQSFYNHGYGHGCYDCEKESRIKINPFSKFFQEK